MAVLIHGKGVLRLQAVNGGPFQRPRQCKVSVSMEIDAESDAAHDAADMHAVAGVAAYTATKNKYYCSVLCQHGSAFVGICAENTGRLWMLPSVIFATLCDLTATAISIPYSSRLILGKALLPNKLSAFGHGTLLMSSP